MSTTKLQIIAVGLLVIAVATTYAYTERVKDAATKAKNDAAGYLERAQACERSLAAAQRAINADRETREHADRTLADLDANRTAITAEIDAIIDSGRLDDRVCELARAAYHSAICASTGTGDKSMRTADGTGDP